MAQILPQNPGSTEIQSPLIAGITEGLNKISATLSLKIGDLSDVSLSAVPIDSSDKNKNRIYEAGTGNRLWLSDPAPVIKKNGEVIEQTSERFTIDYVGGSITFPEDSKPSDSDTLTVTCKYIIGTSETISQIQDQLSQTSENASKYKGYFETEGDLKLEHPTASDGDFALVMSPLTIYAWTSGGWKDTRADANLDAHLADFNNPHRVYANQIGAETPEGAQAKADVAKSAAIAASDPKGSAQSVLTGIESGDIVAAKSEVTGKFENPVSVSLSGAVTGTATGFSGDANLEIVTDSIDVSKATEGTLDVERGGTGKASLDAVTVGTAKKLDSGTGQGIRFIDSKINLIGNTICSGTVEAAWFRQKPENYGTPVEVGQFIDMHKIGSEADLDLRMYINNDKLFIANPNAVESAQGYAIVNPGNNLFAIQKMTISAYNALETKVPTTLYIIVG